MKITLTVLILSIASLAQGQSYRNCSVAYRNAASAAFNLEAAHSSISDPDGSIRLALDAEGRAYMDAASVSFLPVGNSVSAAQLCSVDNLTTLDRVTKQYESQIEAVKERRNDEVISAAEAALQKHRR